MQCFVAAALEIERLVTSMVTRLYPCRNWTWTLVKLDDLLMHTAKPVRVKVAVIEFFQERSIPNTDKMGEGAGLPQPDTINKI